jgi:hypothetical protein
MRDGEGLFEVEPIEKSRPQTRTAAADKRFRAFDPHQALLLPPSLDDWLPEGHLARFVADLVDEVLDLGPVLADYTEKRGCPPYDPRLMVRLRIEVVEVCFTPGLRLVGQPDRGALRSSIVPSTTPSGRRSPAMPR